MIFNIASGCDIQSKIEKFMSFDSYDTFVTDAIHIYGYSSEPWRTWTNVWLIWKPGDPVEQAPKEDTSSNEYLWATTTLFVEPYALAGATNIYIPYATSIETFNKDWVWTSDGSGDNLVYDQQCFDTTATIHVNSTLRSYMASHTDVWGNIINNVVADL